MVWQRARVALVSILVEIVGDWAHKQILWKLIHAFTPDKPSIFELSSVKSAFISDKDLFFKFNWLHFRGSRRKPVKIDYSLEVRFGLIDVSIDRFVH